jgi:hypothetical protein
MITLFCTARQLIVLDALRKGQKCNQEYFVHNLLPSLLNEKKRFSGPKTAINFPVHMDNSTCYNEHQVVDELRRLKIFRAPRPRYSRDISSFDFGMLGYFKEKVKDRHMQGPEEILMTFQKLWDNFTFEEPQMVFESWRDRLHRIIEHHGEYFP